MNEPAAGDERAGNPRQQFWLWAAANNNPFIISSGVLVAGLGLSWPKAAAAVVVGVAISYPFVGIVAVAGLRGGAPTLLLSRATFGHVGNKLPTFIALISCIGWEAVALFLAATATRTLVHRVDPDAESAVLLTCGLLVTGTVTVLVALCGYRLIVRAQRWITIAIVAAIVGYGVLVVEEVGFPASNLSSGDTPLVAGIAFVAAAGGLSWVVMGADYSRHLASESAPFAVAGWTTLGGALAPVTLMLFGVFLSTARSDVVAAASVDPLGAITLPLPTWFCIPFLMTTIVGLVGSGVINLYSSGLNLRALGIGLSHSGAIVFNAIFVLVGTCYLLFISPSFFGTFQTFLTLLGVVIAAWCSVFVADFLLHRRRGYEGGSGASNPNGLVRVDGASLSALVLAACIGLAVNTAGDPRVLRTIDWFVDPRFLRAVGSMRAGIFVSLVSGAAIYALLVKGRAVFRSAERRRPAGSP
ncbi:purine-cytosine permease family protein [Nocardia brasiliensis]|uniref:purine-cytosine permease family protein n=1 Tax=Nocardia brasiliensis TaxID=37326 RepID=UPI003D8CB932